MLKSISILSLLFLTIHIQAQPDYKLITLNDVMTNLGNHVTICDSIVDTYISKRSNKVTYLNFGSTYPNAKLTAVIFEKDVIKFDENPAIFYKDKKVCIEGKLIDYKGKPEIIVNDPKQISIIFTKP